MSDESELRIADSAIRSAKIVDSAESKAVVDVSYSSIRCDSVCGKFSGRQLRVHNCEFGEELSRVCETVEDTQIIINDTKIANSSLQMFQNVDNVALFVRQCSFVNVSARGGFLIAREAFNLKLELKQTVFERLRMLGGEHAGLVGTMVGYFVVQNVAFVGCELGCSVSCGVLFDELYAAGRMFDCVFSGSFTGEGAARVGLLAGVRLTTVDVSVEKVENFVVFSN